MNSDVQSLLNQITEFSKKKLITKSQVVSAFEAGESKETTVLNSKITAQHILYYIGALVVLIGIIVLLYQNWSFISDPMRIAIALGSSASAYSLGFYFAKSKKPNLEISYAFFMIAAILLPVGFGILFHTLGLEIGTSAIVSLITALLLIVYITSYLALDIQLYLPFVIGSGSILFISFTNYLFKDVGVPANFGAYRMIVLGISYLLFGYYFFKTQKSYITGFMYFFGSVLILGVSMMLQGYSPRLDFENIMFQIAYPFLLVWMFGLSVKLQSRTLFTVATLFIFAEILKITSEYFSKSVGWPISLIVAGLMIMATGYASFQVRKRYLNTSQKAEK